ncbi:hypothetical protein Tsp_04107 [Trichinella spiralis]|uniref:hypothetical protein n=1 Tax=Trichinella spiralis TaxID=6334 RepID=UPI0001EFB551|nr:hypothetical protein Tsp_04107 [Trichinella spiralis]
MVMCEVVHGLTCMLDGHATNYKLSIKLHLIQLGEPNVEIWHQVLLKCSVQLFLTFLSLTLLQMGATLFSAGRFFCGLMMTLAISVSYEHRCHRMEHIEEQYDGPSMILFACWSTAV